MRKLLLAMAIAATTTPAQANLVLNGGFETNTSSGCDFNKSNAGFTAAMANASGFGSGNEIDIMEGACLNAPGAQSGTTYVGIHTFDSGHVDAFSLALSAPLAIGATYRLELYARGLNSVDDLEIGLSTSATDFGSLIYSTTANFGSWQLKATDFLAAGGEAFLTFRAGTAGNDYVYLDTISLVQTATGVPEPAALGLLGLGAVGLGLSRRRKRA